jgi:glutamate racemase
MNTSIVFFDSGVGGLPYLAEARKLLPGATLHYIADDAGFPYGTKAMREVEDILLDRVRRLRARLVPRAIVIACNTASQIGLAALRRAHPDLPIIGTVPAIKPAAETSLTGRIGVMATERAIVDPYIDDLIARFAPEQEVMRLPAQDLVSFVERRYLSSSDAERRAAVEPYVRRFLDGGVDRIVLACTHYLHLEKDIQACVRDLGGEGVEIVDSCRGVANRIAQIVGADAEAGSVASAPFGNAGPGRFFLTSEPPFDPSYAQWSQRFGLQPPERL